MSTKRALISTANKNGVISFAKALHELQFEIIATGKTAGLLRKEGIKIKDIAEYTGHPEMLSGRVKTLHPKVHGGILARRGIDDIELSQYNIPTIDIVVVNLYPFAKTIEQPGSTWDEAIEQIDIGGPTLLRAAAKNHKDVTVIIDPIDYDKVILELRKNNDTAPETRQKLALKVFQHTAQYDDTIAQYFAAPDSDDKKTPLPPRPLHKQQLRYGENPQQEAHLFSDMKSNSLTEARCIQGKALSYNNLVDADAAIACVRGWKNEDAACAIIKHATPCGVAIAQTVEEAYQKALSADPTSAFGGIIAVNNTLDENTAVAMKNQFIEVIIAPSITSAAQSVLSKKTNCRILICSVDKTHNNFSAKSIDGGLLIQSEDKSTIDIQSCQCVTLHPPSQQETNDLSLAWHVARQVKSNAIVFVKNGMTVGIGTGQTSRVFSVKIAALKAQEAGLDLTGAAMASDAFFPFPDGVKTAAQYGITSVIQPGGSKRDDEVINAANKLKMSMLFTGIRHFKH